MSKIDFRTYIEEEKPKKLALIHHWDTDGLASAAILLEYLATASPKTAVVLSHPAISNYVLTEGEYGKIADQAPHAIITVDLNFPLEVIERLEKIQKPIFVFDHHSQTAEIHRPGVQSTRYPGCSFLLHEYMKQPISLLSILGMVGDQEERIQTRSDFYPQVKQMMDAHHLSFDKILRITKLIDTVYMVGDDEGFASVIDLLRKDPQKALTDQRLLQNEQKLQQTITQAAHAPLKEMAPHLFFLSFQSPFHVISEVTRQKSRQHPDDLVMVEQQRGDSTILYVRRRNLPIDLGSVVELARSHGYNSGGKPEVAGIVLPTREAEQFRQQLIDFLKSVLR